MTTQTELQRARQIVEHNKTFILDAISHRYAELFKFLSDYDFVYHKGTEEEEQELDWLEQQRLNEPLPRVMLNGPGERFVRMDHDGERAVLLNRTADGKTSIF